MLRSSSGYGRADSARPYAAGPSVEACHVREIVAGVVTDGSEICLVRRSMTVESDPGLWHCVTGYLENGNSPRAQIMIELQEELGLLPADIRSLREGAELRLSEAGSLWVVHTFEVTTSLRRFTLNWENDGYAWLAIGDLPAKSVEWLDNVLASVVS